MDVGLCYEMVLPARGGCEHYITDLAHRLARDGHSVHLFACEADSSALPASTIHHRLPKPSGPRFLRPWRFAESCLDDLRRNPVDVSIGFDKTWGQDILYPQGGVYSASRAQNLLKHRPGLVRTLAGIVRALDPAAHSFGRLERRQYQSSPRPHIVAISEMTRGHFLEYLGIPKSEVRVLHAAIDPDRFAADDRPARRDRERRAWSVDADEVVGLFVGMNYRLKGLGQLIRALALVPIDRRFRIVVVGGKKYERYEALARRIGVLDRVRFQGFRPDPRDAYFAADFLVHPTFYDPCSLVALEALACGLPVVTSQFNGAGEKLDPPHDGLIVQDPHTARELADAITGMIDPDQLSARKVAAMEAGHRWTFEDHYRRLIELFKEVVARKRQTAVAA
jgi:UDP-glucose:(heptosyl)LPS alpha-1,3-glucosyltransferase